MKVAVTAVGGGVGQSVLKALKNSEYEAVAIDPSINAMGLYFANHAYLGENMTSPNYINRLIEICQSEGCSVLFPGFDQELEPLCNNRELLKSKGITAIVGDAKLVSISDDKMILQQFLKEKNFPGIQTASNPNEAREIGLQMPMLFKPRVGARSIGVQLFNDWSALCEHVDSCEGKYVLQEYIEGDEYTCGSVTFEKDVKGVIVMRRILRDGDTYKAFVEKNNVIEQFLYELLPKLNPFGPCNVQLRLKNNIPYVFEINARCSGTTGARAAAGFNEPVMICDYLNGKQVSHNIREVAILRYWNEHVVEYSDMERLKNEGSLHRS